MIDDHRWVTVLMFLSFVVILVVLAFTDYKEQQIITGTIQDKVYQAQECTMGAEFDVALNMVLPKEECDGPYWKVTIDDTPYTVSETLYSKLDVGSSYTFSQHPFRGLIIEDE